MILNLEKVFSNLEPEGQGGGIVMGVTPPLLLGPFYYIQTKFSILLCTRLYISDYLCTFHFIKNTKFFPRYKKLRQLWSTLYANSSIYLSFLQSGSATILEYFASDLVAGVLKVHDCIRNLHSDGINDGLNIKRANKSVSQKSEVIWNKKKREETLRKVLRKGENKLKKNA